MPSDESGGGGAGDADAAPSGDGGTSPARMSGAAPPASVASVPLAASADAPPLPPMHFVAPPKQAARKITNTTNSTPQAVMALQRMFSHLRHGAGSGGALGQSARGPEQARTPFGQQRHCAQPASTRAHGLPQPDGAPHAPAQLLPLLLESGRLGVQLLRPAHEAVQVFSPVDGL